jgi:hypothetical protein
MADSGLIDQAGSILLYVAPGFFARLSYEARFPRRESGDLYTLVVSVAASVPIVALGHFIAREASLSTSPTTLGYVLMVLAISVAAGYVLGWLRDWDKTRKALHGLGLRYEPEGTLMERTIFKLPVGSLVTVLFKDGRVASGIPTKGTGYVEEGEARELYLAWPRWSEGDGKWTSGDGVAGLLINLDEVVAVELADDPG